MISEEEKIHRDVLERFLRLRHMFARQASLIAESDRLEKILHKEGQYDANRHDALAAERALHNAHIFEFPASMYVELRQAVDRYVCELAGFGDTYNPVDQPLLPPGEIDRYNENVREAMKLVPFPDPLPFESVYLGWGEGIACPPSIRDSYGIEERVGTVAHVITAGFIGELLASEKTAYLVSHWTEDSWIDQTSLTPWTVAAVIGAINANGTLIKARKQSLWDRMLAKRKRKGATIIGGTAIPPLYYSVPIRPQTMVEQLRKEQATTHVLRSHRWDVRGHFNHRVVRGQLVELTDDVREDLIARRYKILIGGMPIDADATSILIQLGQQPPRLGEFVALLRYWQRDHIRGPAEKPYIPSSRRLASGSVRPRAVRL